jgi:asparagine synthase (glutamine-hydrolysing)
MVMGIYGSLGEIDQAAMGRVRSMLQHRGSHEHVVLREPGIFLACRNETPPSAAGGDVPLIFAGTITNLLELAVASDYALSGDAHLDDASPSDARNVLWALYRRFGAEAFERINGAFAIAIADTETQSIVLAVDRWGSRPLCFVKLFAARDEPPRINVDVVAHVAATKYLPLHGNLARGIHTLGPGEYARLQLDTSQVRSYSPLRLRIDTAESDATRIARLEHELLAATRRLVGSRPRVGIGLSAGLDSVLTLAAVRAVAPAVEIFTYTVVFDANSPVLTQAREAARHFSTQHREIVVTAAELPTLLPELLWRMEDPVAREEMVLYHLIAQHAAAEVPLVLYGHLADMLFGGMPRHMLIKMATDWRIVRRSMLEFYAFTQSGERPRSNVGRLLVAAYQRGHRVEPPRPLGDFALERNIDAMTMGAEALNEILLLGLTRPSEIGALERIHAWAGVDFGSLFHDREVANCAFSIPSAMKIRGRTRKHVLRLAASKFLPETFSRRPKDLVRIKRDEVLAQVLVDLRRYLLSPASVHARALFDPEYVDELFNRAAKPGCRDTVFYHLWTLLLVELWCRAFGDSKTHARAAYRRPDALSATAEI